MTDDYPPDPPNPSQPPGGRWKERYERQIQDWLRESEDLAAHPDAERRKHPRVTFPAGLHVFMHDKPKSYEIRDLSAGGVSFFSDHEIAPSTHIVLSAMGVLALEVEVVGCEMEAADEELMEYRYRVRAKFGESVDGYEAFVLAREIYQQGQSRAD